MKIRAAVLTAFENEMRVLLKANHNAKLQKLVEQVSIRRKNQEGFVRVRKN